MNCKCVLECSRNTVVLTRKSNRDIKGKIFSRSFKIINVKHCLYNKNHLIIIRSIDLYRSYASYRRSARLFSASNHERNILFSCRNSGRYDSLSVTRLSIGILQTVNNQLLYYNSTLGSKLGTLFAFNIEPFIPTYFDKSQGGAYPHVASNTSLFPIEIEFSWALPSDDEVFISGIKLAINAILQAAINDGQDIAGTKQIVYPNYALEDTPLEAMYGENVARLQSIRKAWDPENIMYLTGGFKF